MSIFSRREWRVTPGMGEQLIDEVVGDVRRWRENGGPEYEKIWQATQDTGRRSTILLSRAVDKLSPEELVGELDVREMLDESTQDLALEYLLRKLILDRLAQVKEGHQLGVHRKARLVIEASGVVTSRVQGDGRYKQLTRTAYEGVVGEVLVGRITRFATMPEIGGEVDIHSMKIGQQTIQGLVDPETMEPRVRLEVFDRYPQLDLAPISVTPL